MKTYWVYIMASHRRVLYIGVTSDLPYRVAQHKRGWFKGAFTSKYKAHYLVYFEQFSDVVLAIEREKELKHCTRAEKIKLIESKNPRWRDLSEDWKHPRQVLPPPSGRRKDDISVGIGFVVEEQHGCRIVRLQSSDKTNRLTRATVISLTNAVLQLRRDRLPLILTGNSHFFSAGADLEEIRALSGSAAYEFAQIGQQLMNTIAEFPAPVIAAIDGYCMGGGLDLALACHYRIAAANAIFGHRGAALGLITGWGGTQRLPRLIGRGRALQMFLAAEKIPANEALRIGLVNEVANYPAAAAFQLLAPDV